MKAHEELAIRLAPLLPGAVRDVLLAAKARGDLEQRLRDLPLTNAAREEVRRLAGDPRMGEILRKEGRARVLLPGDCRWPARLEAIPDPPRALVTRGDARLLERESIAIVGTRRSTRSGEEAASACARRLAELGYAVCSGGALGIDRATHEACPASSCVAVIAGGVECPGPRSNLPLLERVAADGLLLSEVPPWISARPFHFPRRNRLISGLSRAVILIQVPERSGALITARCALDQGREVWVLSGPFGDPRWAGGLRLVREGARLVSSLPDLLAELARLPFPLPRARPELIEQRKGREERMKRSCICRALAACESPPTLDLLARRTERRAEACAAELLELEIQGLVQRLPGERWRLAPEGLFAESLRTPGTDAP